MILYPAIDLKGGACVRLVRGDMGASTVMNADPADQAARFAADGFGWLHVVDLDGAIQGRAVNADAVATILAATSVPVQLGGGVRDRGAVERWLEAGIARVILGTAAVRDPDFVREAARAHPGRIAVAIDVRDGRVAVAGWIEASTLSATDVARRFEDAGVAALIITDVGRDGTLGGVNVAASGELADTVAIPVIASGGVASIEDIVALKARAGRPIAGVVLGRALYAGRIDAAEALARAA